MRKLMITSGSTTPWIRAVALAVAAMSTAAPLLAAPAKQSAVAPAQPAQAEPALSITVDTAAIKAVLAAVRNPQLTMAEALRVAALPGNQGLIRKARGYGRPGTDELFAKALMAAATRNDKEDDPGRFRFGLVRDRAARIEATLVKLEDPAANLLGRVKATMADFAPRSARGHVTGYLIAGGTSGGFAFGGPEFYLNLDRFPSAALASTIIQHELFHAVQGIVRASTTASAAESACIAKVSRGEDLSKLLSSLEMEGSASLVGDVTAMPAGIDAESDAARDSALRKLGRVDHNVTLLELAVHGLQTGTKVGYGDIYAMGFYGEEPLYTLGYAMARAIAAEEGKGAIAELTGRHGALFVERYRRLKGYGKSDAVPVLHPATLQAADQLAACLTGVTPSR